MTVHPRELYEAHRHSYLVFAGIDLPHWDQISWQEKLMWESRAAEEVKRERQAADIERELDNAYNDGYNAGWFDAEGEYNA